MGCPDKPGNDDLCVGKAKKKAGRIAPGLS
jgi:hypothetical protein